MISARPSDDTPSISASAEKKVRRVGAYGAAIFFGGFFGFMLMMVVLRVFGPGQLPEITPELFAAARQKWKAANVTDYDLEVAVIGRQPATYTLKVRGGVVQEAYRDGQPLRQQRTLGTWSVDGMWETMDRDMAALAAFRAGTAAPGTPQLQLRGMFDPELGIPLRYQRTEIYKFSDNQEVSWDVRGFQRH